MNRDDPGLAPTATRTPAQDQAWHALFEAASAPYRRGGGNGLDGLDGRFAWHFARGKLGRDPVFRAMLERGDLPPGARVVDIGCGQGLLASLLQACGDHAAAGAWPAGWPAAPSALHYTGIELMPRDVARARAAVGGLPLAPQFVRADLRQAALPACDVVVILDVLHYVDHAEQALLLARVRDALAPRGRLLLRVGDKASRRGFAVSQWVDRLVTGVRGHRVPPTFGRPVAAWVDVLVGLGFTVQTVSMSRGTPFANVLLVAQSGGP